MSNQQWPSGPNPWSQPSQGWQPPKFQEHPGRDPRAPFNAQSAAPTPEIDVPKKPVWPIGVAVILATVIGLGLLIYLPGQKPAEPSAQPPASSTVASSPKPTGNALPFDKFGGGIFEIIQHSWVEDGLELEYRITLNEGTNSFRIIAYLDETRESYLSNEDETIFVDSASPATGKLRIAMPRGDSTIILSSNTGRPVTALAVSG